MRKCEHSNKECKDCFKDRIRSISTSASATPSRYMSRSRNRAVKDKTSYNSWEKGIPTDNRGMPYLNSEGAKVNTKELAEGRHKYRSFQKTDIKSD